MTKKLSNIYIILFIGTLIYISYLSIYTKLSEEKENKISISEIEGFHERLLSKLDYEKEVSFVMAGDALIHQSLYLEANKNGKYDFRYMLDRIKPIVSKYDLAYYNQETILGGSGIGLSTYPRFNSPYEVGDAFLDAGFNIVSLANNHTLDRGKTAIVNAVNYWNSKKNVLSNGSSLSYEERNKDRIFTKNGITYTMLSYATYTNGIKIPNGENYLVNMYSEAQVKADIERVRDKVDVLMVAMHWGTEYTNTPTNAQKKIAKFLADNKVDIVIGSHPHVVEPVEYIGNTLVIYSLGNFISAQNTVNQRTGLLMSVTINKKVEKGVSSISFKNPTARLIYTYYKNTAPRTGFKVYPYDELNDGILNNYKSYYNTYMDVVTKYDKNIIKYPLTP